MRLDIATRMKIARAYWAGGKPTEVGKEFGVTAPHVLMISKRYDRERHEMRRERPNPPRRDREPAPKRADGVKREESQLHVDADAMRLARLIPDDTRNYTARFMGDPLPGRSALDRQAR